MLSSFELYRRLVCFLFGGAYIRVMPSTLGQPSWFHVHTTDSPDEFLFPGLHAFTFTRDSSFVEELRTY
jgi:hypothetical protein